LGNPAAKRFTTTTTSMRGYTGERPPQQFNMARYCIGATAAASPEKPALLVISDPEAPPERWSYAQVDDAVRRVAAGLRRLDLPPEARIMIRMENTSDYALMFFGAIAAGLVALPSSSQLTAGEAAFLVEDAGAAVLAVSDELRLDTSARVKVLGRADIADLKATSDRADYADTPADAPAFLVYTSGTGGTPKGVLHAHRSAWGRRPMYQGWYGIQPADVILHAGAFNWTYTLGVGLTDPWANGATAVLYNGLPDVTVWPLLMERHGATIFATVPGLYRRILKYCDLGRYDLSRLRHGLSAGEALSPALAEQWHQASGTLLYEALAMSECSTYISSSPTVPPKSGSPGRPQPGRSVSIIPIDGSDTPLEPGESGLLAVHRSDPGLMLGYWNRPDEEALVYRGDWFVGGDLAAIDDEGYVWYHGRNDDVMNAMGYRVSPGEVEAALAHHPAVAEVAVTELTAREGVKVIAAFVVPRDADEADAGPILAFAEQHLAAYKRPREVIFANELPRTANGKVQRRRLADLWRR
jgi:acyl-coenzyme A synthetase/AMP-(fatty) acid ligase